MDPPGLRDLRLRDVAIDPAVLLFAASLCVLASLAFGLGSFAGAVFGIAGGPQLRVGHLNPGLGGAHVGVQILGVQPRQNCALGDQIAGLDGTLGERARQHEPKVGFRARADQPDKTVPVTCAFIHHLRHHGTGRVLHKGKLVIGKGGCGQQGQHA